MNKYELRDIRDRLDALIEDDDEQEVQHPEPGTFVWFRQDSTGDWLPGIVSPNNAGIRGDAGDFWLFNELYDYCAATVLWRTTSDLTLREICKIAMTVGIFDYYSSGFSDRIKRLLEEALPYLQKEAPE